MGAGRGGPGEEICTQVMLCAVLKGDKGSLLGSCLSLRTLATVSVLDRGSQPCGLSSNHILQLLLQKSA